MGVDVAHHLATAVLAVTGSNAIVDWVWLELRSAANTSTVVAARAALLQRDGDVVELDGKSPVSMRVPNGSYNLVVKHRNHLGIMATSSRVLSGTPTTIDLRSSAEAAWGTNARKNVGSSQTMWSGEVTGDRKIKYTGGGNDRDAVLTAIGGSAPTATVSGYLPADVNLDGAVKFSGSGNDRDPILLNIGGSSPTATVVEQLP